MTPLESASVPVGTPFTPSALKATLLGSGELGKEIAIELQRFGVEVLAVDRYPAAPAMQVAHRSQVVDMLDEDALLALLESERPHIIIPEVEAIATAALEQVESDMDWRPRVVPTARATSLTMDREGIRRLVAEEIGIPTSDYRFVDSAAQMAEAAEKLGFPCVAKPVMSSSGKGQSVIKGPSDAQAAWDFAQADARSAGKVQRCIVEAFVPFDQEITLLTVRNAAGTVFFDPIHHLQKDGDYAESWQAPAEKPELSPFLLTKAEEVALRVTDALGGYGVFGVELFVVGDEILFSEVSPRPHDTGLVTLVSGDVSEFAAHARAILGLPLGAVTRFSGAAASIPIKAVGSGAPVFEGVDRALSVHPSVQVRLFGKPWVEGERRVAVVAARGHTVQEARENARRAAEQISVTLTA